MTHGHVQCGGCGKQYPWKQDYAGRRVKCKCGQEFVFPPTAPGADDLSLDLDLDAHDADAPTVEAAVAAAPVAATASGVTCPSCHNPVSATAVLCVGCGYNLREGKQLTTQTGVVRASTGPRGKPRRVETSYRGNIFERFARGWELAKISYSILWDFKQLLLFPVLSTAASLIVLASFILPLYGTGTLDQIDTFVADTGGSNSVSPVTYALVFLLYFCLYFVIVFFNTALTACAMKVTVGEVPTLAYGLSIAVKRLPQIAAWSLVSAAVGLLLKVIENAHEKIGAIIAAILGSGWTILTYFVVPILCVEGVGPVDAVKKSFDVLRETWGEGLVGNAALSFFSFLLALPLYLLLFALIYFAVTTGAAVLFVLGIGLIFLVAILHAAITSAGEGVFRALLYNYATGRAMPADIDEDVFAAALAIKA